MSCLESPREDEEDDTEYTIEQFTESGINYGLKTVGGMLILIAGCIAASIARGSVREMLGKTKERMNR